MFAIKIPLLTNLTKFFFFFFDFIKDTIKQCQTNLEKQLLKFISSITPKPQRPIRQLIARIFVIIYIKGDSRTLFDTITALQSLVGVGKNVGEKETKL